MISGAMYAGEPMNVSAWSAVAKSTFATPRSPRTASPSFVRNTFAGFTSRCSTLRAWRYSRPSRIWHATRCTVSSPNPEGNSPVLLFEAVESVRGVSLSPRSLGAAPDGVAEEEEDSLAFLRRWSNPARLPPSQNSVTMCK